MKKETVNGYKKPGFFAGLFGRRRNGHGTELMGSVPCEVIDEKTRKGSSDSGPEMKGKMVLPKDEPGEEIVELEGDVPAPIDNDDIGE